MPFEARVNKNGMSVSTCPPSLSEILMKDSSGGHSSLKREKNGLPAEAPANYYVYC
ncbi:MAG: hypothetical protein ACOZBH_02810 [Patescibacteria group bacterium]